MATISCRACICSLKCFDITNDHGASPRLRMPRDVTRKAHSNQKTRGDVLLLPALPIASRGSLGVGASEQQDSQCQTRSRFCLAPVKQVDSTHSKHTRTHIGTHGAPMGGYHTDTQAHRHTGTQAHRHTQTHTDTERHTSTLAHRHTGTRTHVLVSKYQDAEEVRRCISSSRSAGQVSGQEMGEV